jgi:hypothetical protein
MRVLFIVAIIYYRINKRTMYVMRVCGGGGGGGGGGGRLNSRRARIDLREGRKGETSGRDAERPPLLAPPCRGGE